MSGEPLQFIGSAPRGLADLLGKELLTFGATEVRERSTDVSFRGSLETAYRACLWSRTANRVFLELGTWEVQSAEEYYAAARQINWSEHIAEGATLACDFSGRHPAITHTHFGALKLKDAIVDSLRESVGFRPDIETDRPSVRVHAHALRSKITLSLDLSGESLHRRGYRGAAGEAPLKENVAAGVLLRAGWPELAASGAEFLDPMCGSGTFVIEAAMIAANIAPGIARQYFGFMGWRKHDAALWERLRAEALAAVRPDDDISLVIRGQDRDPGAIRSASANAQRAKVDGLVRFSVQSLVDAKAARAPAENSQAEADETPSTPRPAGLVCVNPPYGVRLEDHEAARALHRELGDVLRARFEGWTAAVLTGSPDLGLELGIRAHRTHTMWNGAIECRLLRLNIGQDAFRARIADRDKGAARVDTALSDSTGARMFANRLGKNIKQLQRWVRDSGVSCYRIYDADMPEYAFAIDVYRVIDGGNKPPVAAKPERASAAAAESGSAYYSSTKPSPAPASQPALVSQSDASAASAAADAAAANDPWHRARARVAARAVQIAAETSAVVERQSPEPNQMWLSVQEYAAPASIDDQAVRRRRAEAFSVLPEVTGVPAERIRVRMRRRQSGSSQYQKVSDQFQFHMVEEGGLKFRVNFDDYLDTGLFLDHRPTRARIRELAAGKRFLNLFSYTGAVTVYAAAGGARTSASVDLSRTYLDWAERNLGINGLASRNHSMVQADCREWLEQAALATERYDLIFLDPPTFSNSKRMEGVLDIGRDHAALIDASMRVLAAGGLLVFSTNAQKFKLDAALSERYEVKDISTATVPRDFERNPKIHRCYDIRRKGD